MTGTISVCVGRFQAPRLHDGYSRLFAQLQKGANRVIVFIGVSPAVPNKANPLSYSQREAMVSEWFTSYCTVPWCIYPLIDQPTDEIWSQKLDDQLETYVGMGNQIRMVGGRDSFLDSYKGKHEIYRFSSSSDRVSSTALRNGVTESHTVDFREGVVHAMNVMRPLIFPTVDIAVVNGSHVLMGRKKSENYLRFPGGFVDSKQDKSFEQAACRELKEETGIEITPPQLEYVGSYQLNDWRYQGVNKIFTTFYCHEMRQPQQFNASDDLDELKWLSLSNGIVQVLPLHVPLFTALAERFSCDQHSHGQECLAVPNCS